MRNGLVAAAILASILTLPTIASADDTSKGVVGGAVAGAIVGGPVGAVVGGVIGGTVGAVSDDERRREDRRDGAVEVQPGPGTTTTCVEDSAGNCRPR